MSEYTIGGRNFKSKKAVADMVRIILESYREGNVLDADDTLFLLDLLQLHPRKEEKIGCGVAYMKRTVSPTWKTACFQLVRYDGSSTEFSWRECLYPSTHDADIKKACREAIKEQIEQAKKAAYEIVGLCCPITGEELTKVNLHIDHEPPMTFAVIYEQWKDQPNTRKIKITGHRDNSDIVRFDDPLVAKDFAEFHRKRAKLRPLSVDGNYTVERLFRRGIII